MKTAVARWTKASLCGGLALAAVTAAVIIAPLVAPKANLPLDVNAIRAETGYAYVAPVVLRRGLIFAFRSDASGDSAASSLVLLEDGRALGPAHTSHDEIRAKGGGRFSHWGEGLFFSTSDNSDPRMNGRSYVVSAKPTLASWIAILLLALDAAFVLVMRKSLLAIVQRHRNVTARGLAAASVAIALIAAGGVVGGPYFQAADWPLAISIAGHAGLAVVLTLAQWAIGAGVARALLPKRGTTYTQVVLLGFPVSLVAMAMLVAVALLAPLGGALSIGIGIVFVLPLVRWPLEAAPLRDLLRRLPVLILLSAAFGAWLALQWHGPTSTLPGSPTGDLTFYASMTWVIAAHPVAWFNLGNEGESFSYFNALTPALGAAIRPLLEVDGFLFVLTMTGVSCLLGTAIAIHAYAAARPTFRLWSLDGLALVLAILATIRYPYWIAESPPVAHVAPLTIAVWFWIAESRRNAATPLIGLVLAFIGSATTKVASLIILGALALEACGALVPKLSRRMIAVFALMGAIIAAYAAAVLTKYLPFYLRTARVTPESYDLMVNYGASLGAAWPYLAREAGYILMSVVAFRLLQWPAAVAVAGSIAAALAFPFLLRVNFMCASIVLALASIDEPRLRRPQMLLLAALLLNIPAIVLTEPGGAAAGLGWLAIGSMLVFAALHRCELRERAIAPTGTGLLVPTALAVVALTLVALARGVLPSVRHAHSEVLTPQARDIWSAVRERLPRDALVFTDQSGPRPTLLAGWNTFAMQGQRQIYHANWYQSLKLRNAPELRDARLAENDDVLSSRRTPADVPVSRHYDGYYAVVSIDRKMGTHWQRIYGNNLYAIYRWVP